MCGTTYSSSATSGVIYDSGGPSGYYSNYESCSFLIKSNCNSAITLYINSFSTESGFDYLTVYNGSTTSSPVLGNYSGTIFSPSLVATSGFMLIRFYSDGSATYPGFALSWSSLCTPVANFNSNINSCQGSVFFTSTSLNSPTSYYWDFSDGTSSTLQNPSHTYTTAGTYAVQLTASNNYGSNTITKNVSVNPINFAIGYVNPSIAALIPITFTTDYVGANYYSWNFGDATNTATTQIVQHNYQNIGTYSVTLNLSNSICVTTRTLVLNISDMLSIKNYYGEAANISVAPNPTSSDATIIFSSDKLQTINIKVCNTMGMLIEEIINVNISEGENKITLSNLQSGLNLVQVNTKNYSHNLKITKLEN
jgi:PKD repeat protein